MNYVLGTGAVALFLAIVCAEGVAIAVWRYIQSFRPSPQPLAKSAGRIDVMAFRRELLLGFAIVLLTEGGHDAVRAYGHMGVAPWPQAASFWLTLGQCGGFLFMIRTFTRSACGEWGWVASAILPALAMLAMIVVLR